MDALQAAHDSLHFGRRLCRHHTRLEARDDLEPVLSSIRDAALAGHGHRQPQIRTPRFAFESLGRHADDGESSIVEADGLPDRGLIPAEPVAPQPVADDRHRVRAGDRVFLVHKRAP